MWTLPSQTVRRFFCACANILSTQGFCRRENFVNKRFLLRQEFCQREIFGDASILLTPKFCRCQYFVNINILSTPIFCQHQHFVNTGILLTSIFCWRQYFVDANILSMLDNFLCHSQDFPYFELCSICLREGLGRSKPATNPWNKHNNTTVGISTISKPYWTVFYRIKWALHMWVS